MYVQRYVLLKRWVCHPLTLREGSSQENANSRFTLPGWNQYSNTLRTAAAAAACSCCRAISSTWNQNGPSGHLISCSLHAGNWYAIYLCIYLRVLFFACSSLNHCHYQRYCLNLTICIYICVHMWFSMTIIIITLVMALSPFLHHFRCRNYLPW